MDFRHPRQTYGRLLWTLGCTLIVWTVSVLTAPASVAQENLVCGISQPVPGGYRQLGYHLADRKAIGIAGAMRIDLTFDSNSPSGARLLRNSDIANSTWSHLALADAEARTSNLAHILDDEARKEVALNIEEIRTDAKGPATRGWLELRLVPDRRRKNILIPVHVTLQLPPLGSAIQSLRNGVLLNIFADERLVLSGQHTPDMSTAIMRRLGPMPELVMQWDPTSESPTEEALMVRSLAQALLRDQEIRIEAKSITDDSVFRFRPSRPFKWSLEYPAIVRLQPHASRSATAAINGDASGCEQSR